jgi:cellulose synthase/poly-beta-1,6-N-acetylglucosamine synthase-like glycosyltransferase
MNLVSVALTLAACLLAIPVAVFFFETLAAIAFSRRDKSLNLNTRFRPNVAVLVPAHNESSGLIPTLDDIKAQMRPGDRLIVVADNCTDDTAAIAAAAGAEVVARRDPARIGKGYALDFGLRHLSRDPRNVVVMIDADCSLSDQALERLVLTCAATGRPVQAHYVMAAPRGSTINYQVAEFAWRVRNWVRPLGLSALGLPCQLMGTGMAFPWNVISSAHLAHGQIVEDLQLGLDLTLAGNPPLFCPSAIGKSHFPSSAEGATTQRERWERGHVDMVLKTVPRLLYTALTRRNMDLLALTLDLAVPPLSLLALLVISIFAAAGLAVLIGLSSIALIISSAKLLGFVTAVFLSWLKFGRDVLPAAALLSIPIYVINKVPLYKHILSSKRVARWTRTDRR